MTTISWAGRLLRPGEAAVAADDPAYTVGRGLFETLQVRDGRCLDREPHLARLLRSAEVLGFSPVDPARIDEGVTAVLEAAGRPERARLRYTVSPAGGVVVTLGPLPPAPESLTALTCPWPRNDASPLVAHKTSSYGECALALEAARHAGADEALFRNTRGHYCEGATSNLFLVRDGELRTPPLTAGILPGVTRELVMAHARAEGLTVTEAPLTDLTDADEVFLTSSLKDIAPVTRVDGRRFPVGPVTARLRTGFRR